MSNNLTYIELISLDNQEKFSDSLTTKNMLALVERKKWTYKGLVENRKHLAPCSAFG